MARHPDAIISNAVENQNPVAIRVFGPDFPPAKHYAIRSTHVELFPVSADAREGNVCFLDEFRGKLPANGMKKHGTDEPPTHSRQYGWTQDKNQNNRNQAPHGSPIRDTQSLGAKFPWALRKPAGCGP